MVLSVGAVVILGSADPSFAGPHHFQRWFVGDAVSLDARAHKMMVRSNGDGSETTFEWDRRTEFFEESKPTAKQATIVEPSLLKPGEHVRVLYQQNGKMLVARRVIKTVPGRESVRK